MERSAWVDSSVADPGRFDADLDPNFHADADPDPNLFSYGKKKIVFKIFKPFFQKFYQLVNL